MSTTPRNELTSEKPKPSCELLISVRARAEGAHEVNQSTITAMTTLRCVKDFPFRKEDDACLCGCIASCIQEKYSLSLRRVWRHTTTNSNACDRYCTIPFVTQEMGVSFERSLTTLCLEVRRNSYTFFTVRKKPTLRIFSSHQHNSIFLFVCAKMERREYVIISSFVNLVWSQQKGHRMRFHTRIRSRNSIASSSCHRTFGGRRKLEVGFAISASQSRRTVSVILRVLSEPTRS